MNIKNGYEETKTYAKSFITAAGKSVFKIGLFVTGASAYFTPWLDTPFGKLPVVQVFAALNIIIAVGWEVATHFKKPSKKSNR
jgi:hypothetical protein